MRNRTYGGVRGRKTKVGRKLLRFPPTRLCDKKKEAGREVAAIADLSLKCACCETLFNLWREE